MTLHSLVVFHSAPRQEVGFHGKTPSCIRPDWLNGLLVKHGGK
jgi:hypothetical protein